jgi:cytochrome c2
MVQAMWNHDPAMLDRIKETGMDYPALSSQDIVDIAAYIRHATAGNMVIRMSPGNPAKGRALFKEKQCTSCHLGEERAKRIAPHLSRIELKKGVTEIASLMWNHGPVMMEYMDRESIEWPRFKGNEMADLIAYIYFLGFEDEPGDDQAGLKVFQAKGCADCHKKAGGRGPDLSTVKRFESPIRMIQLMWNHAAEMEDLLIVQNKEWPQLTTKEMRDLYAYLREVTQE